MTSCRSPAPSESSTSTDNLGAVKLHLTADDLALVDAILPAGVAAGSRYSEQEMQAIDR